MDSQLNLKCHYQSFIWVSIIKSSSEYFLIIRIISEGNISKFKAKCNVYCEFATHAIFNFNWFHLIPSLKKLSRCLPCSFATCRLWPKISLSSRLLLVRIKNPVCSTILVTGGGRTWIYAVPKIVSAKGNAKNIIQDLNSGHRLYFQKR